MISDELLQQYKDFQNGERYCFDSKFQIIEMTGADRASFLHNFCTADIKKLATGESSEAFVLNIKGKTLAFIQVLCLEESLAIVARASNVVELIEHLSKYLISEKVEIIERKDYQVAICGFQCTGALGGNAFALQLSEKANLFVTTDAVGASQAFASLGKKECSPEVIEMIRVEAGYPFSDFDVSADHLAQEFNRDATAISYEKGCYLGQETVARLDALGHTNRSFVQATIQQTVGDPEESPRIGDELFVDQKKVATISSMAFSPMHQCILILATVRKPHHKSGSELLGKGYVAKVV